MRLCALLEFELAKVCEQEGVRAEARLEDRVPAIAHPSPLILDRFIAIPHSFTGVLLSYAFVALILCVGMLAVLGLADARASQRHFRRTRYDAA